MQKNHTYGPAELLLSNDALANGPITTN